MSLASEVGRQTALDRRGLTRRQKQIVELVDLYGLSFHEAARRQKTHAANIKRIYDRARKKLDGDQDFVEQGNGSAVAQTGETPLDKIIRECLEYRKTTPINDATILQGIDDAIAKILFFVRQNDAALAKTSPKDQTSMLNTLIDKRQLLKGEPTGIMKIQDIRKLDEAAAALDKEMKRRGLLIDVTPDETA